MQHKQHLTLYSVVFLIYNATYSVYTYKEYKDIIPNPGLSLGSGMVPPYSFCKVSLSSKKVKRHFKKLKRAPLLEMSFQLLRR
jgi:hypothetical protein